MTLPLKMIHSLRTTRMFLLELMNPQKTPGLPREVRQQAGHCIKHYPLPIYEEAMLQGILDNQGSGKTANDVGYHEVERTDWNNNHYSTPSAWWNAETVKVRSEDVPLSDFDHLKENSND